MMKRLVPVRSTNLKQIKLTTKKKTKMPNHITNRLIIEGATEEVAKVFDFLKADKPNESGVVVLVDFNKLVPMPESLEVESSSEGNDGKKYLLGMSGNSLEVHRYKESDHYKEMTDM